MKDLFFRRLAEEVLRWLMLRYEVEGFMTGLKRCWSSLISIFLNGMVVRWELFSTKSRVVLDGRRLNPLFSA